MKSFYVAHCAQVFYLVVVNGTFVLHDIVEMNEINGYAVITMHWIATWMDDRLALPCTPPSGRSALSPVLQSSLWRPGTIIVGVTQGLKQTAPITVQSAEIRYDGMLSYSNSLYNGQRMLYSAAKLSFF